ncbi:hypothetical protein [Mesoaciditoga lauensis]|uniref:hypothetical protein n=1 Tax=Mesoaciditoga lauensis TaxID=1495039 RepID=UPI0012DFF56B|nr:hypothetical protein [Mesoaciditoga lauensis]
MDKFKRVVDNPRVISQFELLKMMRMNKKEANVELVRRSLEGYGTQKTSKK